MFSDNSFHISKAYGRHEIKIFSSHSTPMFVGKKGGSWQLYLQ